MANITECLRRNVPYDVQWNALTSAVSYIPMTEHAERMVILVKSSGGNTVTINPGDAEVWGGLEELNIPTANGIKAVVIDTARYVFTSGVNANCIGVYSSGSGDEIAVIHTC